MLNELKLVCGFVQYPRTFVPSDCLDSTMTENCENNCYDRPNISFPSLLLQVDHPSNEMFPAEPLENRDTTVSNRAETTAIVHILEMSYLSLCGYSTAVDIYKFVHNLASTNLQPTVVNTGGMVEIVVREGVITRENAIYSLPLHAYNTITNNINNKHHTFMLGKAN
ncbi:hypothetical protein QTP88_012876 [Uroleucon formosanum]